MSAQVKKIAKPWAAPQTYKGFNSKFAPAYKVAPNVFGITFGKAARWAPIGAYFGAAAGLFVFFMFAEIPRVSEDIAVKIPIIGPWFHKEVAPEDNPF